MFQGKKLLLPVCLLICLLSFAILIFFTWSLSITSAENYNHENEINFTILHTNDEHSAVIPHSPAVDYLPHEEDPTRGGFSRLATAVEEIREEKDEPVLLFNAGDFLGGGSFGWLAPQGYAAELSIMQEIGYDAIVIGNHEFDFGPEVLADYLIAADYPRAHENTQVLASNMRPPEEHPLAQKDLYRQTAVTELDEGLKIGKFGLMGDQALLVTADTGELEFLDPHKAAEDAIEKLEDQGADIIIAITHSGIPEDRELARNVSGIDVIVGGHCHTALEEPIIENNTYIVQAGQLIEYLGYLELAYNPQTENLRIRNEENNQPFLIPIDDRFPPHPEIAKTVDYYQEKLNDLVSYLTEGKFEHILDTVARSDFKIAETRKAQESPVGNFVTDAMREVTENVTGEKVDVAFQTNGNIRQGIKPGSMEHSRGDISFYEITEAVGLGYGEDGYAGYPIVSFYLTGAELYWVLEGSAITSEGISPATFMQISGMRYTYNPDNAVMFTIPFWDIPIPSTRSVMEAEIYTGEGKQPAANSNEYVSLERGDEELYHVVTDSYLFSFFTLVSEYVPQIIEPKDAQGKPLDLDNLEDILVHHDDGRELKMWETVIKYAAAQPPVEDEIPSISSYYAETSERITQESSFPAVFWPILLLVLLIIGIFFWRRRKHKKIDI